MIRPISIGVVLNGYKVAVGCQELVFTSRQELLANLERYLIDPDGMEKHFLLSSINAIHTANAGMPAMPTEAAQSAYSGAMGAGSERLRHRDADASMARTESPDAYRPR